MKWQTSLLSLFALAAPALAQEAIKKPIDPKTPAPAYQEIFQPAPDVNLQLQSEGFRDPLAGDRDFPGFIGFVSNPTLSLDPRALTQIWPVFGMANFQERRRFDGGDMQVYGPGLSVALSERFAFGISEGGYVESNFRRNRDGWLDLGGFVQYSLIRDVEKQFILTTGLQCLTPWMGSQDIFQGNGPTFLAPYVTVGKAWGEFHFLGTAGYQFPVEDRPGTTNTFYANVHFDRRCFGWFYPLVEFNCAYLSRNPRETPRLDELRGFFAPGRFDAAGGITTLAAGFNAVIVQNRLEFGAVYISPVYSDRDLWFNAAIAKMIIRY